MKLPSVSYSFGCFEAVLSLDTGYRAPVSMVQKGCETGRPTGQMQSNRDALLPDYSVLLPDCLVVRSCATDFCNADLATHDTIPNLSQAPNPQTLSGTECYACVGVHPEDCAPEKSRRVQCHQDQSVCFQGNGRMTFCNFSVPVYIRTCYRPSCTTMDTIRPWTDIDLRGFCCEGHFCNRNLVTQSYTTSLAPVPPLAPQVMVLLLEVLLLVGL
ncbi:ly6/PLAUR domain-containing protein 5-like [Lemur catta]|uniref:ly6/PLAUR domain-containing protein 5-like n=1 Tax=Lemur catta TaxID=9447 RepID=UPI001E26BD22|nr:ly6/PLAUR domain-containing protein 5-like [Lemur catta]